MLTSSVGRGAGSGRYITVVRIENTPVLMPMPSAMGTVAAAANPGLRRSVRRTYRTSLDRFDSIPALPFSRMLERDRRRGIGAENLNSTSHDVPAYHDVPMSSKPAG